MKNKILIALALLLAACAKEDPQPSVTQLLTKGTWRYAGQMVDLNGNGKPDENWVFPGACTADDKMTLQADGSYSLDRGASLCRNYTEDPTSRWAAAGTWQLHNGERTLQLSGGDTDPIVELNEQQLVLMNGYDGQHALFQRYTH